MCPAIASPIDVAGIGRRITQQREQRGLKQLELAARAGMSEAYINRLENGIVANPKLKDLTRVAQALDVALDILLYGSPPRFEQALLPATPPEPRLAHALGSLAQGLRVADLDDREFVLGQLESLARRFGYDSAQVTRELSTRREKRNTA